MQPNLRIIKQQQCSSASGKSVLTYHVAVDDKQLPWIRIASNSGGGLFSPEWVSLDALQEVLASATKPVTSYCLRNLFQGRSSNTPAFLLAALVHEGLLSPSPEKQRCYVPVDVSAFLESCAKAHTDGIVLTVDEAGLGNKTAKKTIPASKPKAKAIKS